MTICCQWLWLLLAPLLLALLLILHSLGPQCISRALPYTYRRRSCFQRKLSFMQSLTLTLCTAVLLLLLLLLLPPPPLLLLLLVLLLLLPLLFPLLHPALCTSQM
jgi:hypothetical protein